MVRHINWNQKVTFLCYGVKTKEIYLGCLFLSIVILYSCNKGPVLPYGQDSLITGLATPVFLEKDTTFFLKEDYFDDVSQILDIIPPPGLLAESNGNGDSLVLVSSDSLPPLSVLTIKTKSKHTYHILLIKSNKKTVDYSFDPGEMSYTTVQLTGDINAWNPNATPLSYENDRWTTTLSLTPGLYGYQVVTDDIWILDPHAEKMDNGMGGFNSIIYVEEPDPKSLPSVYTVSTDQNKITLGGAQAPGQLLAFWENTLISNDSIFDIGEITIPKEATAVKRSVIRVFVHNENGQGNNLFIPVEYGQVVMDSELLDRNDLHTQIMYFLMVDRFFNGDPNNDRPVNDPMIHPRANFHGGDIQGVVQKLEDGFFEDLGVNTIWLSPVPKNPEGAYGLWDQGGVKSTFSSYHGYWPTGLSDIDLRFGDEASMRALIQKAHERNMNIVLDFVAHHIHEEHPLYRDKKEEGWFTDLYLPDGTLNTERWDDHRLTTWFDTFLPTFNFFKPEVNDMLSDTAVFWLYEYGIDGFRHDATKHIHLDFWRTLTKKVKKYRKQTGRQVYQVGETYGTPELIASYIQTGMLDAQFDFNVFDAILNALCRSDRGFEEVNRRLRQSLHYYGYHHLMGNMSGNQDRARFMALATGEVSFEEDAKLAGWTRSITRKTDAGYKRLALMHLFNLTIPGVPCIYYGDEIGLTGGNDPDNRRMMRFENWDDRERSLFDMIASLTRLRRNHPALIYGDFTLLETGNDILAFSRKYFDHEVLVIINKNENEVDVTVRPDVKHDFRGAGTINASSYTIDNGEVRITIPGISFEMLVK
jgi:cyclomaltodextrinase / maltogenic alpha-amylase / neopullulanase